MGLMRGALRVMVVAVAAVDRAGGDDDQRR
jgi:hypothetical protein